MISHTLVFVRMLFTSMEGIKLGKIRERKTNSASFHLYVELRIFFCHAHGMCKFPGQGMNLHHSSNQSHCSDNARSLTCCATGELLEIFFFKWTVITKQKQMHRYTEKMCGSQRREGGGGGIQRYRLLGQNPRVTRMSCTARRIQSRVYNNFVCSIIYKNTELLCCTSEINIVL